MNSDFLKRDGQEEEHTSNVNLRRATLSRMKPPEVHAPKHHIETPNNPEPHAINVSLNKEETPTIPEPPKVAKPAGDPLDSIDLSLEDAKPSEDAKKPDPEQKKKLIQRIKDWAKSRTKKQWIIIGGIAFVVVLLLVGGAVLAFGHKATPIKKAAVVKKVATAPKPTIVPSTLSGLPVAPEVNNRPVTGVMIENSTDARPQSGLGQAGVVFEAIAEGGITRFLALFQDTQPDYIGPVRSARPYYLQWLLGFDASLAHVGGSPDALADIKSWGVKDLDQFANGDYYQRISTRYAPHNVYTSVAQLNTIESNKGYGKSVYTGFARKSKEEPAAVPTAKSIDFIISSYYFNVHYDYDQATNTYKRSEGGAAHVDEKSGQLAPKVVVALAMSQSLADDGLHTVYNTFGTGQGMVFQDGKNIPITWHKADAKTQFTFTDANNKPVALDPGQTWISIVGGMDKVTFTP